MLLMCVHIYVCIFLVCTCIYMCVFVCLCICRPCDFVAWNMYSYFRARCDVLVFQRSEQCHLSSFVSCIGIGNPPPLLGATYGFHPGGWGKPPVNESGQPLYGGDLFGQGSYEQVCFPCGLLFVASSSRVSLLRVFFWSSLSLCVCMCGGVETGENSTMGRGGACRGQQ